MKTRITVSDEQFQRVNVLWDWNYKRMLLRYLSLQKYENEDAKIFVERYFFRNRARQKGPLTPAEIEEMTAIQEREESTIEARSKEIDVTTDIDAAKAETLEPRFKFAYLLQETLKANPGIKSVANIGARVDLYSAYLSPRFPNVTFQSVDFQSRLKEHNALLPQSPNWTFLSGYPLEVIRSGRVKADMYFFAATACVINNKELNAYLDAIAPHAKAIAFCEAWFAKLETIKPRIVPPEQVPKERPYCGGSYASFHHNYLAKLEERGYRVALSDLLPASDSYHYLLAMGIKP